MRAISASAWVIITLCGGLSSAIPVEQELPVKTSSTTDWGLSNQHNHLSKGGTAQCVSGFVHVEAATDSNIKFNYELPKNQTQVTQLIIDLWSAGRDLKSSLNGGFNKVAGNYSIGATLCFPPSKDTNKIQILTHGIGYDRRYWDLAADSSYVDTATSAGYTTLAYDRLGVGRSSKEDPIQAIQSPLELAVLNQLVSLLRAGHLGGQSFKTVIGVGHSFGSALTQGLTASNPTALDAVVLTGFSTNTTGMPAFSLAQNPAIAAQNDPSRWGGLSAGYLVVDTPISLQSTFLHAPGFSTQMQKLSGTVKNTVTIGEYLTTGNVVQRATHFRGPVAVVAGNEDFGFCSGNCSYPVNVLAEVPLNLYPNVAVEDTTTYRAPSTGHGLNFHYSANAAFDFIQDFLQSHGV